MKNAQIFKGIDKNVVKVKFSFYYILTVFHRRLESLKKKLYLQCLNTFSQRYPSKMLLSYELRSAVTFYVSILYIIMCFFFLKKNIFLINVVF